MTSPSPELASAYRTLDVAIGSDAAAVRAAWHTLVKVWHPDRHANDPAVLAHAERKLREVNAAYEAIRAAGFPPAAAGVADGAATSEPVHVPTAPQSPILVPAAPPPARSRRSLAAIAGVAAAAAIASVVVLTTGGNASPHPASTPAPAPDGSTFTLGSTAAEVRAAQGEPTQVIHVIDTQWSYGFSTVEIADDGKVVGWWSLDVPLHVRLEPHDAARAAAARARGTIHRGSDRDEVLGVEGVPTHILRVINTTWSYSYSSIDFDDDGKVIGWMIADRDLHVAAE